MKVQGYGDKPDISWPLEHLPVWIKIRLRLAGFLMDFISSITRLMAKAVNGRPC